MYYLLLPVSYLSMERYLYLYSTYLNTDKKKIHDKSDVLLRLSQSGRR